jgi:hypothetical protein
VTAIGWLKRIFLFKIVRSEILLEALCVIIILCNIVLTMFFMVLDKEFLRRLVEKFKKSPEISPCDKDHPGSSIKDTAGPSTSVSLPDIAAITESDVIIYIYEFKTFILTK